MRDALPWAFGALVAAFVILLFLVVTPPAMHGGAAIAQHISLALLPAFGIMAFALAVALPLAVARRAQYSRVATVAASFLCFVFALPHAAQNGVVAYLRLVGATGIFLAILMTGVVATGIALMRFPRRRSHMGASLARDDTVVRDAVGALAALGAVAVAVFVAHVDISQAIAVALQPLARMGDTYPAFLAIVAVEMLLWTIGVHGPAILAAIVTPVYLTLQMQNTSAFAAKMPLPHVVVVSLFLFVFPGGSGATLPLAALLSISRVPRLRKLGRIVIFPAIANVNEPLIFGLPIVLNPYMLVPFVVVPLVLASVTYAAVVTGLVARPAFYIPSSVPAPLSTYLATLDPRAPLLLCVNLAIALALYLPFVRAYERHLERTG